MSPADLQAAKDELAALKAEHLVRLTKGKVQSTSNGSESVSRAHATFDQLVQRIRELEAEIRAADVCAFGAIHLR